MSVENILAFRYLGAPEPAWIPCYCAEDFTKEEMAILREVMEQRHGRHNTELEACDYRVFGAREATDAVDYVALCAEWQEFCDFPDRLTNEEWRRVQTVASGYADQIRKRRSQTGSGAEEVLDNWQNDTFFYLLQTFFDKCHVFARARGIDAVQAAQIWWHVNTLQPEGGLCGLVRMVSETHPHLRYPTIAEFENGELQEDGSLHLHRGGGLYIPVGLPAGDYAARSWLRINWSRFRQVLKANPAELDELDRHLRRLHRCFRRVRSKVLTAGEPIKVRTRAAPEPALGAMAASEPFIPTPLQREILMALKGIALKKQALADLVCKGEGTVLYRPGGIKELRAKGLVSHKQRIGFYRPDAPPPGTITPG